MELILRQDYAQDYEHFVAMILHFDSKGELFGDGDRNVIRLFKYKDRILNIKKFKNPNLVNSVVYNYFRPSKAKRSYNYAIKLLDLGIGTPEPIGYAYNANVLGFKDSYYISEHLACDLTYRELVHDPAYPEHEIILRAFTDFTFKLHESGVLFKDHSPGNTLIKKTDSGYKFYLVDLNRMNFKSLTKQERIANFARLSPKKEMVAVMSDQYAKLSGLDPDWVFNTMWGLVSTFQEKYHRKVRLKKKFLFWRN